MQQLADSTPERVEDTLAQADRRPPLRLTRPALISADESARVHELAKGILQNIGIEVFDDDVLGQLQARGLRTRERRVFFEPATVDEFVAELRRQALQSVSPAAGADDGALRLRINPYALYVHNIEDDSVLPYSSEQLIEMCKLLDSLADAHVYGAPPGIPSDVHPDMQPLAQYRIAALHCRQGGAPVDPTSARTVNYLLDMAEALGHPVRSLPVYMATPLRLGGESLHVVLACLERLSLISISSMPSTGATAPLQPFGALAVAAAEVIGGAIAVQRLTGKPVTIGVGIFPFDLRSGAMDLGSPEHALYQMLGVDFGRLYGSSAVAPGNLHSMAKLPDCQSAAEKAATMTLGALLGVRTFWAAGQATLVFSPEQLLLDCEIRDAVQRVVQGLDLGEGEVDDWLAVIQEGVQHGFMGLDSTLDGYTRHAWYPRHFQRGSVGAWLGEGRPNLSHRLRSEVRRRIAGHRFALDSQQRNDIERIYQAAERAVSG